MKTGSYGVWCRLMVLVDSVGTQVNFGKKLVMGTMPFAKAIRSCAQNDRKNQCLLPVLSAKSSPNFEYLSQIKLLAYRIQQYGLLLLQTIQIDCNSSVIFHLIVTPMETVLFAVS